MSVEADRIECERLHIMSLDLNTATRFLEAYLDRTLHEAQGRPDGALAEALTVAIVVTYAKSFTGNKNRSGKKDPKPSFLTDSLSPQQRGLHHEIVDMRDQVFAHADASPLNIEFVGTPDSPMTISDEPMVLLEKRDAEGLLEIVRHLQVVLEPRLEQRRAVIDSRLDH